MLVGYHAHSTEAPRPNSSMPLKSLTSEMYRNTSPALKDLVWILQLQYIFAPRRIAMCAPADPVLQPREHMDPSDSPGVTKRYSLTRSLRGLYVNGAEMHVEYIPAGAVIKVTGRRCVGDLVEVLWERVFSVLLTRISPRDRSRWKMHGQPLRLFKHRGPVSYVRNQPRNLYTCHMRANCLAYAARHASMLFWKLYETKAEPVLHHERKDFTRR